MELTEYITKEITKKECKPDPANTLLYIRKCSTIANRWFWNSK